MNKFIKVLIFTLLKLQVILSIPFSCLAQVNLELNDFKYIKLSGSTTSSGISATVNITVPSGKVWKIVSAGGTRKDGSPTTTYNPTFNAYILIDDVKISSQPWTDFDTSDKLPIWLPTGTYSIKLGGTTGTNPNTFLNGFVNAIEFLIVPK